MPLQDYPSWELKPRVLTQEEREHPELVIHNFFGYGHLPEIRKKLWEMLKTTVTGDYCRSLSWRDRSDMIYFYEHLEKLIEAVHVLHRQLKEKGDA